MKGVIFDLWNVTAGKVRPIKSEKAGSGAELKLGLLVKDSEGRP